MRLKYTIISVGNRQVLRMLYLLLYQTVPDYYCQVTRTGREAVKVWEPPLGGEEEE